MRIRNAIAAAAVLAAAIGPVVAASTANAYDHGWKCTGYGDGPTPGAAHLAAMQDMIGNVTVGQWIYTDGQNADGSYWELISADCVFVQ